jgi:microcystin-dependent protein
VLCDGSSYARTGTYANLFAVIGTTYGSVDGSHFNVPDLRGIFAKGAGTSGQLKDKNGAGNYFAGTLGAYEQDYMQGHKHSLSDPGHYHTFTVYVTVSEGSGYPRSSVYQINPSNPATSTNTTGITMGTPVTDGNNGSPSYGPSTQPANCCLTYIIKV